VLRRVTRVALAEGGEFATNLWSVKELNVSFKKITRRDSEGGDINEVAL